MAGAGGSHGAAPPSLSAPRPSLQAEFLRSVFEQFGNVQFVKYLREKGEGRCLDCRLGLLPPHRRGDRARQGPQAPLGPGAGRLAALDGAHMWAAAGCGGGPRPLPGARQGPGSG